MDNSIPRPARRHAKRQWTMVPGDPITGLFFTFTPVYPSFIHSTEAAEPTPVEPTKEADKPTTKKTVESTPTASTTKPTETTASTAVPVAILPTGSTSDSPLSYTGLSSPTDTPESNTDGGPSVSSAAKKGGISGGGIAAIVIILMLIMLGGAAFFVRRRAMAKRKNRRTTWGDDIYPKSFDGAAAPSEKSMPYAFASGSGSAQTINPPPMSYNNIAPLPTGPSTSAFSTPTNSSAKSRATAVVHCTFIPSLPDELSISTGDVLNIDAEYDDGWALCTNTRGEQGMVPVECLNKTDGVRPGAGEEDADWRSQQRASSLIFRDGVRY